MWLPVLFVFVVGLTVVLARQHLSRREVFWVAAVANLLAVASVVLLASSMYLFVLSVPLLLYPVVGRMTVWPLVLLTSGIVVAMPLLGCVRGYLQMLYVLVLAYPAASLLALRASQRCEDGSSPALRVLAALGLGLGLFWAGLAFHVEYAPAPGMMPADPEYAAWVRAKCCTPHENFWVREAAGFPFRRVLGAANSGGAPEYWPPGHGWPWFVANWVILTLVAGGLVRLVGGYGCSVYALALGATCVGIVMNVIGAGKVLSMLD